MGGSLFGIDPGMDSFGSDMTSFMTALDSQGGGGGFPWETALAMSLGPTIAGIFGTVSNTQAANSADDRANAQLEWEKQKWAESMGLTREQMAQAEAAAKLGAKLKKRQLLLEAYNNAAQGALQGSQNTANALSNAAQLQIGGLRK